MANGAGYNIPVSLSAASSVDLPENTDAQTTIVFSSPGSSLWQAPQQEANPINPATATSSAAEGNAAAESAGSGVAGGAGGSGGGGTGGGFAGLSTNTLLLVGAAVGLVVLILMFRK